MAMRINRAIINSEMWFMVLLMVGKNSYYFKKARESHTFFNFLNLAYTY